jgi:AcrR family transcriptional regulator
MVSKHSDVKGEAMPAPSKAQPSTRQRILNGAARLIRDKGIARATTREIARAAGVSEGSLFNHFTDKLDLLGAVLAEASPQLAALRATAGEGPGSGDLAAKLAATIEAATDFYLAILPLEAGVLADRALLERWRERHANTDTGPQTAHRELGAYLRAEQHLGRARADIDPEVLAIMLLGAAQYAAFIELVTCTQALARSRPDRARQIANLIAAGP